MQGVKERVYVQVYATFATCLIMVGYMVFALQIVAAAGVAI